MMSLTSRKIKWLAGGALALAAGILIPTFLFAELKPWMRHTQPLPVYGPIADFTLTNQNSQPISLADLRGHVWVADVIFTRCAGSCPQMTRQMRALQQALPTDSDVRLVTLTTDPQFDTPAVLARYAERFGADPTRWMFLTGTKKQIARLAVGSLKLSALPKGAAERTSPADLFVHSTIFVVVGKHAQLRGVFETTGEGVNPRQVEPSILEAVSRLERES